MKQVSRTRTVLSVLSSSFVNSVDLHVRLLIVRFLILNVDI